MAPRKAIRPVPALTAAAPLGLGGSVLPAVLLVADGEGARELLVVTTGETVVPVLVNPKVISFENVLS